MSGNPIDKYLTTPAAPVRVEPKETGFTGEAGGSPRMIDFVSKSGDRTALPYPYLVNIRLQGNTTIEIIFTETIVKIRGRRLGTLYQHLVAQTVRRIEESASGFDADRQTSWVETISVEQRK